MSSRIQNSFQAKLSRAFTAFAILTLGLSTIQANAALPSRANLAEADREATDLLNLASRESGRPVYTPATAVKFRDSYNVYLKSTLGISFAYRKAWARLPLYRGEGPDGRAVYYILTEVSESSIAEKMGLNFSPKMRAVIGSSGAQEVTVNNGVMKFKGAIDFSPVHKVVAGVETPFPPTVAQPGAVADAGWSSFVVTPSGVVYNAQVIANHTGRHDRVVHLNINRRTVKMSLLDGYQNGKQYFYHLVTDASADVPAALENGVYAPKLAGIPGVGSLVDDNNSAVLGFSPLLNGRTVKDSGVEQGFNASLANGGIDPINVFPFGPQNADTSDANNYSPMWDAHISQWTDAAVGLDLVRRVKGFEDLQALVNAGLITSAYINPEGPGNPFVFNIRPSQAFINCPVIAHPILPER